MKKFKIMEEFHSFKALWKMAGGGDASPTFSLESAPGGIESHALFIIPTYLPYASRDSLKRCSGFVKNKLSHI